MGVPAFLRFVPVDFEAGDTWWQKLPEADFDPTRRAIVASTGVSMYLSKDAVAATLRQVATLAPGSTFVMSFMLPLESIEDPGLRAGVQRAMDGARANGTPWLSFFTPGEMLALASESGFTQVEHVSADALSAKYFAGRSDGLRLPSNTEELLVART